jgi:excinuclease ABC subunit C
MRDRVTLLNKTSPAEFTGFGPSLLASPTRGRTSRNDIPEQRMEARAMLHDHCPLTPGVYGWLDANNQICYVGKSKSLRKRLLSYFAKTPTDKKAFRIRQHSKRLVWEPISDELLALIREQELIYRWRPDFNTQGQPTRRQPAFVCISTGAAPNAFFANRVPTAAAHVFGPIAGTKKLREAVISLNQVFRLRDCPDKTKIEFADQGQLFANPATAGCIRYEIGSCPAPCAARCSSATYRALVNRMTQFLEGTDLTILNELETGMAIAAAACQFEKATVTRDHLANLNWLARRLNDLRKSQTLLNGVLPVAGRNRKHAWLLLREGRLIGSALRPDEPERASKAIETLTQIAAKKTQLPETILEMNLQLIIISWFRRNPRQRNDLISFDQALDHCRNTNSTGQ